MMSVTNLKCLSCGVFRNEVEELRRRGDLDCEVMFLDSMLHMNPRALDRELSHIVDGDASKHYLILYGDCHPHMHEMQAKKNTVKAGGLNCCEILLGKSAYRELQQSGAFIFLPEWTMRWKEIFTRELGFEKPDMARSFLQEHRTRLVYVDTGVIPVPVQTLDEIAAYFSMPLDVMHITLDILLENIRNALLKFK
ncbi:MAG: DUF1638 domain-containing protein [Spirochaetes bacterium]|nr:DUF1638 domain-containing protein [Spirochaetota bacterium]